MKKKLISLVLGFVLALALLPSLARAADGDFIIENGVLIKYRGNDSDVTIPSNVTSIGDYAFSGCDSLSSVTIPSSVTSIGHYAFASCDSLTGVTIPSSVTSIEYCAFGWCHNLSSAVILANITSIEESLFINCISLTRVSIPSSITNIETNAFYDCASLSTVYYAGSASQWSNINIDSHGNSLLEVATIYYNSTGPSTNMDTGTTEEYIYNTPDINDGFTLPAEWLDDVTDTDSAVEAVQNLVNKMTDEQKASPVCTDLAALYAETATAKAANNAIGGNDILVDAAAVAELGNMASQTSAAVEAALESGGVTTARYLSNSVTLVTDETDITVRINPDILTTKADKVRVETPTYALTFKLSDLAPDLTQPLTFTAKGAATGSTASSTVVSSFSGSEFTTISMSILANTAVPVVEIDMPGGKTTNSITVSLPSDGGDTTYRTVATSDGTATASKYNPATTMMDGKVNTSGTYTVKSNEKDFTDIADKSAEMQKAIRYLASKGIINGTTPTTFSPDGSINRAEIATLLVKALGKLDSTATASFSDVTKSNWFYTAAASSQRHKLINGYEDNTFRGTTNINKVQIVAVSSRVLTSEMNYKTPSNPSSYLGKYSDSIATWAQSEVALATKENLVVYRTDGTFSGDKAMTRGDAAIIIYRLFQRIW